MKLVCLGINISSINSKKKSYISLPVGWEVAGCGVDEIFPFFLKFQCGTLGLSSMLILWNIAPLSSWRSALLPWIALIEYGPKKLLAPYVLSPNFIPNVWRPNITASR